MSTPHHLRSQRQSRIPSTLQAVFLASNRGRDVHKPPPEQMAAKVFFRNWIFHGRGAGGGRKGAMTGVKKESVKQNSAPHRVLDKKQGKSKKVKAAASALPVKDMSPQGYLDAMIRARGYSTMRYKTMQSAYYSKPTELQQASYDVHLISIIRQGDKDGFKGIMEAGISPNPANRFGESIVHMVCRRGDVDLLEIMLACGAELQVADDYGRTPLHDACWAAEPCFKMIEMILERDPRLFHMTDSRGAVPLSYVRKEHWPQWIEWLDSKKNVYWPKRNVAQLGEEGPPPLTKMSPNSRPLVDPEDALTPELAAMVASGKMEPEEVQYLRYDETDDVTAEETYDDSDVSYSSGDFSDSEYSDDDEDDDDDDGSLDEDEMAGILLRLSKQSKSS